MKIKKFKRKCDVRGCRNIGVNLLTKTNEFGYTVGICDECLKKANEMVNPKEEVTLSSVVEEPKLVEVIEDNKEDVQIEMAEDNVAKPKKKSNKKR